MLIDCPACAASYHVDPSEIEGGRTVICARCDTHWFVDGPAAAPSVFAVPQLGAPERSAGALPDAEAAPRHSAPRHSAPRPATPRVRRRVPPSLTIGLASLALVSLTIGARAMIVQMLPRTAALYAAAGMPVNLRGLDFRDVHAARPDPSSPLVTISGEIRNVAGRRMPVPRLVFEVRDAAGKALVRWSEQAPAKLLAGGRTLAFASAPHQLPADSRSALVHFETDQS